MTSSKIHRSIGLVTPIVRKSMCKPEYEDAYTEKRLSLPYEITSKILGRANPAHRYSRRIHKIGGVPCAEYKCPVCSRAFFDHISDVRSFGWTCGRWECLGEYRVLYLHEYAPLTAAWADLIVQLYEKMRLDKSKELYDPARVITYLRPKFDEMRAQQHGQVELQLNKDQPGYTLQDLRIVIRGADNKSDNRTAFIIAKGGYNA